MSRTKNDGDRDKRQLTSSQSSGLTPSASCANDLLSSLVKTSSSPLSVLSSDDDNDDVLGDVEDKDDIDDDKLDSDKVGTFFSTMVEEGGEGMLREGEYEWCWR